MRGGGRGNGAIRDHQGMGGESGTAPRDGKRKRGEEAAVEGGSACVRFIWVALVLGRVMELNNNRGCFLWHSSPPAHKQLKAHSIACWASCCAHGLRDGMFRDYAIAITVASSGGVAATA